MNQEHPNSKTAAMAQTATADTKESLLEAAEALFAEHGFAGASLRAITARADANVAAAHYHFGSKEGLLRAVVARRLRPMNRVRIARLDEIEALPAAERTLEALIRAFVAPVIAAGRNLPNEGRDLVQLIGRVLLGHDEVLRAVLHDELSEIIARFVPAFAQALPHLGRQELVWRIHFMAGAMAHVVGGHRMLLIALGDEADVDDVDTIADHIVRFLTAGMQAPASQASTKPSTLPDKASVPPHILAPDQPTRGTNARGTRERGTTASDTETSEASPEGEDA